MIKSKKAVVRASIIILTVFAVLLTAFLVVPVLGGGEIGIMNTHTSHAVVTPNIVPGGAAIDFSVEVTCDSGDPIQEFRIYEHNDFTNFECDPVSGWFGPYAGESEIGKYCQWNAQSANKLYPGDSKVFTYSADAPVEECCRTWLMETRDPKNFYVSIQPDICIDNTPPETTKTLGDPKKVIDGPNGLIEWIDSDTLITLEAIDSIGPHDNGIKYTRYKNILATDLTGEFKLDPGCEEDPCRDINLCNDLAQYASPDDSDWQIYHEPFSKHDEPESCHILYYYSEDNTGLL